MSCRQCLQPRERTILPVNVPEYDGNNMCDATFLPLESHHHFLTIAVFGAPEVSTDQEYNYACVIDFRRDLFLPIRPGRDALITLSLNGTSCQYRLKIGSPALLVERHLFSA